MASAISSKARDGNSSSSFEMDKRSAPSSSSPAPSSTSTMGFIWLNIVTSVGIVALNKILVEKFKFNFILLLTGAHFLAGYAFLHAASSQSFSLFSRPNIAWRQVAGIAAAGVASIVLMNYSLRLNTVGTYQILKVAVLPVTIALSHFGGISTPSRKEVYAAAAVVVGTLFCTVSDVGLSLSGLLVGAAAVLATAQYQIYQGRVQSEMKLSPPQALYAMSLPQAGMTFAAAILLETDWSRWLMGREAGVAAAPSGSAPTSSGDIWSHGYSSQEVGTVLATCLLAVLLNLSTIATIGKTSAITMQFVAQVKTVLIVTMGFILFPKKMSGQAIASLLAGLAMVISGTVYYTMVRAGSAKK